MRAKPAVTATTSAGIASVHAHRALLTAVFLLVACGRESEAKPQPRLLPASPDPCGFVTVADVQRLVGLVERAPYRARATDAPDSLADGRACVFTLAPHPGATTSELLAVELLADDAVIFELGSAQFPATLGKHAASHTPVGAMTTSGWDYSGGVPTLYVGRIGHLGVQIGTHADWVAPDSIWKLAALMRDRVPDVAFAAPRTQPSPASVDPCSLLSRAEVEAAVGALATAPYRSLDVTPLAEPRGNGCSYYLGHHRVLTIEPERARGKQLFQMSTSVNESIVNQIGARDSSAHELAGEWDKAGAGTDGSLMFLRGEKMLTIVYRTANIGTASALALAKIAIKRL